MPTKKCYDSARFEVFLFLPSLARGVFRVQQHLLVAALSLLSGKCGEQENFCFPPSHYISMGFCNKRNQLRSGIGTAAAQQYLSLLKRELSPELQKDPAM